MDINYMYNYNNIMQAIINNMFIVSIGVGIQFSKQCRLQNA